MDKKIINEMQEKLEGAEFGIVSTNKGNVIFGTKIDLLDALANIVNNLKENCPKEIIMLTVEAGLEHNEGSKEKTNKNEEDIDKVIEFLKMLKEL